MPFVYSTDAVSNLQKVISRERFSSYLTDAKGDVRLAIEIYERNMRYSQSLFGALQPLEIAFRNTIHAVLWNDTGKSDWYERPPLRFREIESVRKAKDHITRWGHAVTPGRVVSELTFGFWTALIGREYEKTLWVPYLRKAFPHLYKPDRIKVFDRLESIRVLRNRIAHHEKILSRNLLKDFWEIVQTIEWICPTTAAWVLSSATFPRLYGK